MTSCSSFWKGLPLFSCAIKILHYTVKAAVHKRTVPLSSAPVLFCGYTETFILHTWAKRAGFPRQIIASPSPAATLPVNWLGGYFTRRSWYSASALYLAGGQLQLLLLFIYFYIQLFATPTTWPLHLVWFHVSAEVLMPANILKMMSHESSHLKFFPGLLFNTKQTHYNFFFPPSLLLKYVRLLFFLPLPRICKIISRIVQWTVRQWKPHELLNTGPQIFWTTNFNLPGQTVIQWHFKTPKHHQGFQDTILENNCIKDNRS